MVLDGMLCKLSLAELLLSSFDHHMMSQTVVLIKSQFECFRSPTTLLESSNLFIVFHLKKILSFSKQIYNFILRLSYIRLSPLDMSEIPAITADHTSHLHGPVTESSKRPIDPLVETGNSDSLEISRTSTQEFHHVPFEQFSQKIKELCHLLWPPSEQPSSFERTFRGRIVDKIRAKSRTLPLQRASSSKDVLIERLNGGGFNRVIGLTRFPESESPVPLILRVPRFKSARHDREVAAIRFVRYYTALPVPKVEFVDFTANNPLDERYVIQTRIPGSDLQSENGPCWFPSLTYGQKCTVAKVLAEMLLELHKVTHPYPGHIEAVNTNNDCKDFIVHHFELTWNLDMELEQDLNTKSPFFQACPFKTDWKLNGPEERPFEETTHYFLLAQLGRWKALELRRDPVSIGWMDYYDRLVTMAKEMEELGLFADENCLFHRDLNSAPRNIMADIDSNGSIHVTGILDWDSLIFAPRWAACVPPMWLWAWNDEEEEDEKNANDNPATPEQQEVKHIFEETIGGWFLRYAYAPEYRLARKLFQWAYSGMNSTTDMDDVDELLDEWNELYQSHVTSSKDAAEDNESFKSTSSKMVEDAG